ncbi:MAG: SCO family protein [Steroidobacter sp.]
MNAPVEPGTDRSRAPIWILITLFFASLLVAFALYYGGWRPSGATNHGELIDPPRPLPQVALTSSSNAPLDPKLLQDKWTLVYIGEGRCGARCREALTLMRQTRLALNDDLTRVQRVFLATEPCCDQQYLEAEHAGLVTVKMDSPASVSLLEHFPDPQSGRIYIVDPLGNLMMNYAADAEPTGLLDDMKKLLKLSHIG